MNWKEKFLSTNFLLAVILLVGGLFVGFPAGEASKIVSGLFALIGSIGALRVFFKNAEFDPKKWITNSNTWNYLATILISLFPVLTPDLFPALRAIVEAAMGGNWQGILTAVMSLFTIIWNIVKKSKEPPIKASAVTVLILMFASSILSAQSNEKLRNAYRLDLLTLSLDTFDILPQPGEYPTFIANPANKRDGTVTLVTNWGAQSLKLAQLRSRIIAECKNKVHIRITDTGMDTDHNQLVAGKMAGFSYTGEARGLDKNGHATHCTGIVLAKDFGICYDLANVGVLTWEMDKILNDNGSGSFDWFARCEADQRSKDATRKAQGIRTIVSASFGGGTSLVPSVEAAMKANTELGTIYCVAAGNTGAAGVQYPGVSRYSIATGSLDQNITRSSYSTFGPQIWAAEPGRGIQSTWTNNQFATLSGTSMATPFLAGCVAIAVSKWGNLLPDYLSVKEYLKSVSQDISPTGKDDFTGYGFCLIERILNTRPGSVAPPVDPPTPPKDTVPVRNKRVLLYSFSGKFPMFWNTTGLLSANAQPEILKVKKTKIARAAQNLLTISMIEVLVNSTTTADVQESQILDALRTAVFLNRGLVLERGSDYADATYWTAYFTELLLYTQYKIKTDIRVTRIEAYNERGARAIYTEDMLKHFPKN